MKLILFSIISVYSLGQTIVIPAVVNFGNNLNILQENRLSDYDK